MTARREFTITKVERDPEGFYRARVTGSDGVTIAVDNRFGSWQADVRRAPGHRTFVRKFVLPHVAAELQARIPKPEPKAKPRKARVTA